MLCPLLLGHCFSKRVSVTSDIKCCGTVYTTSWIFGRRLLIWMRSLSAESNSHWSIDPMDTKRQGLFLPMASVRWGLYLLRLFNSSYCSVFNTPVSCKEGVLHHWDFSALLNKRNEGLGKRGCAVPPPAAAAASSGSYSAICMSFYHTFLCIFQKHHSVSAF